MGCDIHAYLEMVEDHYTWSLAKFRPGRNYLMFSLMAGVRTYEQTVLFTPRGAPDNMGFEARWDYYVMPDENISREDIQRWIASGSSVWVDEERFIATNPDWHSASWLTTTEMQQVYSTYGSEIESEPGYKALLAAMETLGDKARLVFWFDN